MFNKKIAAALLIAAATTVPSLALAAPSGYMAQMGSMGMKNCALEAKDVRVSVESAGAGFAVKITGKDATQAKEIVRRAQLLVG